VIPRPLRFIPPLGAPKATARQRALADLRGIDLAPLEKVRERPAKNISEVMPRILTRIRMDKRQSEAEILKVWNNLIDPAITAHAQPTGINKGTLFVTVDSSVWLSEIVRYRRREVLDRLQHSFGRELIQRISFRVG
jgi:predicted nucleic acid-binding Zn ribbon protein